MIILKKDEKLTKKVLTKVYFLKSCLIFLTSVSVW